MSVYKTYQNYRVSPVEYEFLEDLFLEGGDVLVLLVCVVAQSPLKVLVGHLARHVI